MQILTVNLPKHFADAITCSLGAIVCQTENISDACQLIENEDFNVIVKYTDEPRPQESSLNTLLGLTPISTKIFLVEEFIPHANGSNTNDACQELGIEVLSNPTTEELINKINATNATSSPVIQ